MQASSFAGRLARGVDVRGWLLWQLPSALRAYVVTVPVVALVVIGVTAANTEWRTLDLIKFLLLMSCGMISVASTPRIIFRVGGGLTREFSTVWVTPIAILLPPVYAAIAPIAFFGTMHLYVHRGVLHRTVFTAASVSLPYAAVSVAFRWFPAKFAGAFPETGWHVLTWALAVAACEVLAGRGQHFLVAAAVKISDPRVRLRDMDLRLQALEGDLLKVDLGVLITLAVALTPALVILALPTVLLVRRFLEHPVLVAQSRTDAKTGLLNAPTWESEAETELSRAHRTRNPLAVALVDIDHFKRVNDTYGHLVGDKVLKAVADALTGQSRDYDRVGRFGGEEFVLLLAQTAESDACRIAERLRGYVAGVSVPVDDRPGAPGISVTVSIGVAAVGQGEARKLADLMAAADSALYHAKQSGRNRVAVAGLARVSESDVLNAGETGSSPVSQDADSPLFGGVSYPVGHHRIRTPLDAHHVVLVQADPTALSL